MNMSKFVAMVCSICFVSAGLAEESETSKISLAGTAGVYNKYLYQWSGTVYDKRPSIQGDFCLTLPAGFYADVWFARHSGEVENNLNGNETDYILGWSGKALSLSLDTALVYYDLVQTPEGKKNNYWAPYIKVSKSYGDKTIISPFVRAEFVLPDQGDSASGGILLSPGVETEIPIVGETVLSGATYLTFDNGTYGEDKNIIFGQTLSLKTVCGNWTFLLPYGLLTSPLSEDTNRKTELCFGFSLKRNLW